MKQALIALLRDTFTAKGADAQRSERQDQDQARATTAIRMLDLSELRQVSGGDLEPPSPKRGW